MGGPRSRGLPLGEEKHIGFGVLFALHPPYWHHVDARHRRPADLVIRLGLAVRVLKILRASVDASTS